MDYESFKRLDKKIDSIGYFTLVSEVITKDGVETVRTYWARSAIAWKFNNVQGMPDDKLTIQWVNFECERIADAMFRMAYVYVLAKDKLNEAKKVGPHKSLKDMSWQDKRDWARWVVYWMNIAELQPVEDFQMLIDGQGDVISPKRLPRRIDEDDEAEKAVSV